MKIQVSNNNYMTKIKDNYACGATEVTSRETAIILGMGRAYGKLKDRIKREGLFSLGFTGHSVTRLEHGIVAFNRN